MHGSLVFLSHLDIFIHTQIVDAAKRIIPKYDIFLCESVPNTLLGENVLHYIFETFIDCPINGLDIFESSLDPCKPLTPQERDFLSRKHPPTMSVYDAIQTRMEILTKCKAGEFKNRMTNIFFSYEFLLNCLRNSKIIRGAERPDYIPPSTEFEEIEHALQLRDTQMLLTIDECIRARQKFFYHVGENHAPGLMQGLRRNHPTLKFNFVRWRYLRIMGNPEFSKFNIWLKGLGRTPEEIRANVTQFLRQCRLFIRDSSNLDLEIRQSGLSDVLDLFYHDLTV